MLGNALRLDTLITPVPVESWQEFEAWYSDLSSTWGRWVFRGQSNANWVLSSRVERELSSIAHKRGPDPAPIGIHGQPARSVRDRLELFFIRAFQARAPLLFRSVPEERDTLAWLSLMQHWGFPTRLLDFTTSPYVALHFALAPAFLRYASGWVPPALYAVHSVPLGRIAAQALGDPDLNLSSPENFRQFFFSESKIPFVAMVHPSVVHERVTAQQGTFLCPSHISIPFEDAMLRLPIVGSENASPAQQAIGPPDFPLNELVRKVVFSENAAKDILPRLLRMNVHDASLFPDVHGYAQFVIDNVQMLVRSDHKDWLVALEGLERLKWLA